MTEVYARQILAKFIEIIEPDNRWVNTKTAADLLECTQSTIRGMQNKGKLSFNVLPTSKYRRVDIQEVYSILADRLIQKEFPVRKFKKGELPY